MHFVEGERIEIPINFDDSKQSLPKYHEASLLMKRNGAILHNCFDKIRIEKSESGQYFFLVLENLENGVYNLRYNFWSN